MLVKDEYECDDDSIPYACMDHVIFVNIVLEYTCMVETMMIYVFNLSNTSLFFLPAIIKHVDVLIQIIVHCVISN
jgi:hypothetical protein